MTDFQSVLDVPFQLNDVLLAEKEFNLLLYQDQFLSKKNLFIWQQKWVNLLETVKQALKTSTLTPKLKATATHFVNTYNNSETLSETRNEVFIKTELSKFKNLFDTVETYPLTEEQRRAIIIDEESNLVVAGAGSGKTSTIIGKIAYLLKKRLATPQDILLLAFNRDVVTQMATRLHSRLGIKFTVRTFHSMGLDVIAQCRGTKPTVSKLAEDPTQLPAKLFEFTKNRMANDEEFAKQITTYLLYHSLPYKSPFNAKSFSEYLRYMRRYSLRSLKGDHPKSFEEYYIANFLFVNNIKYEYKQIYLKKTAKQTKQYFPVFFLPDYNICIAYSPVNRKGKPPPFIDYEKYALKIEHTKDFCKKHNILLVECYHYEQQEGTLLNNLKAKLCQNGVQFAPLFPSQIFDKLADIGKTASFTLLTSTFLNLYKASGKSLQDLQSCTQNQDARTSLFMDIFFKIYTDYSSYLQSKNEIDFNDMINLAATYITQKKYRPPFKYILVDEFQDISQSRYRFLKALCGSSCKLFCVGDDWQSIYRFNGSDLSIMLNFEQQFNFSRKSYLNQTFRFNNRLCKFSTKFILQNPHQIKKDLKSQIDDTTPALTILEGKTEAILEQIINKIGTQSPKKENTTIFVIGRYNFNKPKNMHKIAYSHPTLTIKYTTAHSSKGLEADYIIIIGLKNGEYGFPCQVMDDHIINLVLAKKDYYPNAEERRLFYVAITRAKKHVYLIIKDGCCASDFISEIIKNDYDVNLPENNFNPLKCPICKIGVITERKNKFGKFYACTNYPDCNYTATRCPRCQQGFMYKTRSKFVCSNIACSFTSNICPVCKTGYLHLRKTYHTSFYACSNYPTCKYTKQEAAKKPQYLNFTRLTLN